MELTKFIRWMWLKVALDKIPQPFKKGKYVSLRNYNKSIKKFWIDFFEASYWAYVYNLDANEFASLIVSNNINDMRIKWLS